MKVSTIWKNNIGRLAWYYENRRFLSVLAGIGLGIYLITFLLCDAARKNPLGQVDNLTGCANQYFKQLIESAHKLFWDLYTIQASDRWTSRYGQITNGSGLMTTDTLFNTREKKSRLKMGALDEYGEVCHGIDRIWESYPLREVQGYITLGGKLIITGVGTRWKVTGPRPIFYQGSYYFPWDKRRPLRGTYVGVIDYSSSRHIFIPVRAMFHTHVVSSELSYRDLENACAMRAITHLLIERERMAVFDCGGVIGEFEIESSIKCANCDCM